MYLPEKQNNSNNHHNNNRDTARDVEPLPRNNHTMVVDTPAAPSQKKRAETWGQEETRTLISLRRGIDNLFNTSKSNKHLWEQISAGMREKGFDRSPTMCTDKWRNLLKEFKKYNNDHTNSAASPKMTCYRELQELLEERNKNRSQSPPPTANAAASKLDLFMFSDNGLGDGNIPFGSDEGGGEPTLNLERNLDDDGDPLSLTEAEEVVTVNALPNWNWREDPGNGSQRNPEYGRGRVITVKWGAHIRKISIDGTGELIKEAVISTFRLRPNQSFHLEDEFNVTRTFDRSMPLGEYTLHVDQGMSIKLYDESDHMVGQTVEKTLFSEKHFWHFLTSNGFVGLREINGYRIHDSLFELRPGSIYQGVRR